MVATCSATTSVCPESAPRKKSARHRCRSRFCRGKLKRTRLGLGKRPDVKRATVTLAPGDTIEIFETQGP